VKSRGPESFNGSQAIGLPDIALTSGMTLEPGSIPQLCGRRQSGFKEFTTFLVAWTTMVSF